jgi:hypothetical protein
MKNLAKTYKFIYFNTTIHWGPCHAHMKPVFANKRPSHLNRWVQKSSVKNFFYNYRLRKGRYTNVGSYLNADKATAPEIIRAMYFKFRHDYNHNRRFLTEFKKQGKRYTNDLDAIRCIVSLNRKNMLEFKKQYEQLRDEGAYTYLELIR